MMKFGWENWSLHLDPITGVLIAFVLSLTVLFSWKTYVRHKKNKTTALLEIFRFLLLCLFCLTLLDPKRTEIIKSKIKPQLAVLIDQSQSMDTLDVNDTASVVKSRKQWVESIIQSSVLKGLEENTTILIEPFSSKYGETRTDIQSAISSTTEKFEDLYGILVLTDGDSNLGSPPIQIAPKLRNQNISLFSIFTGSDRILPDLDIEHAWAPSFTLKEERLVVNWKIKNTFDAPQNSVLSLYANDEKVESMPVHFPPNNTHSGNITWLPSKTGKYLMKLVLEPVQAEAFQDNNSQAFQLRVQDTKIKVLVIDSSPRWEYRFLKNALLRDPGVEVKSLLYRPGLSSAQGNEYLRHFPKNLKELSTFDVIFLGDIAIDPEEITHDNASLLHELVIHHAAGIVFIPGRKGKQLSFAGSPLDDLLPIVYDPQKPAGLGTANPANLDLTARGRQHWLTDLRGAGEPDRNFWNRLPGFFWSAMVKKSKPGSQVLATHSNFSSEWGKMPLLVVRHYQSGKSLFLGTDSAWRWRRGVEDKYHYRFWSQVVRWMARERQQANNQGLRLITYPEKPYVGDQVHLHCIASDLAGFPLELSHVDAKITHPDGVTENIQLTAIKESNGIYTGKLDARKSGDFTIIVSENLNDRKLMHTLPVHLDTIEKKGRPVRTEPLSALAKLTGGSTESYREWEKLLPRIKAVISPQSTLKVDRLRTNLFWNCFLFGLLIIYWSWRKLLGLV
jgi:hypothetical protein